MLSLEFEEKKSNMLYWPWNWQVRKLKFHLFNRKGKGEHILIFILLILGKK
jgi:hypothetical protein